MKALRRLLVAAHGPLDHLRFAIERAVDLPLEDNAELLLLHVADGVQVPDEPLDALVSGAIEIVRAAGKPDVQVRGFTREGRFAREVARVAETIRPEFVVLVRAERPTSPVGRMKDRIARGPLRGVAAPVLVIRPRPAHKYSRPLVSVDLHPANARAVVQEAFRLCPDAPMLTVLHNADTSYGFVLRAAGSRCAQVVDFRQRTEERAGSELRRVLSAVCEVELPSGPLIEQAIRSGNPAGAILEEVVRLDADVVVLGRSPASHLFQRILAEAPCDVLVVPLEEREHPRVGPALPPPARSRFSRAFQLSTPLGLQCRSMVECRDDHRNRGGGHERRPAEPSEAHFARRAEDHRGPGT